MKIFEKLPHKNAIKHDTRLIFSQPQVPPSKEFAKKTQGPTPPLDLQLLSIYELLFCFKLLGNPLSNLLLNLLELTL
jgi:hypothetical protein